MIGVGTYSDRPTRSKAMVLLYQVPGQRWHRAVCFGLRSHYYEDGGCEHTDELLSRLTDYGRRVTKVVPFGDGEPPKRPRKREATDAG